MPHQNDAQSKLQLNCAKVRTITIFLTQKLIGVANVRVYFFNYNKTVGYTNVIIILFKLVALDVLKVKFIVILK